VLFPVEDGQLRERIMTELMAIAFQDNVKSRLMKADGTYQKAVLKRGEKPHRSQMEFIARTLQEHAPRPGSSKGGYAKVKLAPRPKSRIK